MIGHTVPVLIAGQQHHHCNVTTTDPGTSSIAIARQASSPLSPIANVASGSGSHATAYRPDIDGIRAIAVLSVLVYHASPNTLSGGFVGVDVFFVISGYLISTILFRSLQIGHFSYADFYVRRIKRIFPALLTVLLATMATASYVLFPGELRQLGAHVIAGALFVSNLLLYTESGYFDSAAETKPLLHLWSLGIEEQFYIAWPIVLALLWKRKGMLPWVVGALALASFGANIGTVVERPSFAFFMPVTRFWELQIGALAAFYAVSARPTTLLSGNGLLAPAWRNPCSVAGLALIVLALGLLNGRSAFPGWWALLPAVGTLLLICAGPDAVVNRTLLSRRPMVYIGLISYPLYLWHWPILVLWQSASGSGLHRWEKVGALALSLLLSIVTYRFIERPLRFSRRGNRVALVLSIAMVFVGLLGFALKTGYIPGRYEDRADFLAYFENGPPDHAYITRLGIENKYRLDCNFYDEKQRRPKQAIPEDCYAHPLQQRLLLWGDSHAQHLRYGIEQQLPTDMSLMQVATAGCAPALADKTPDHLGACNRSNRFVLDLVSSSRPQTVVIAQGTGHELTDWNELAQKLVSLGVKQVVLVGPVPKWMPFLHRVVALENWPVPPRQLKAHLDARTLEIDRMLASKYKGSSQLQYVSAIDVLCTESGCLTYLGNDVMTGLTTWDYGHLTPDASTYLAARLFGRGAALPAKQFVDK